KQIFADGLRARRPVDACTVDMEGAAHSLGDLGPPAAQAACDGGVTALIAELCQFHRDRQFYFGPGARADRRGCLPGWLHEIGRRRLSRRYPRQRWNPEEVGTMHGPR